MCCKKYIFDVLKGVQTFHFFLNAKMQKSSKNCEILKNYGHFQIPHPRMNLKLYSNISKMQFIFWTTSMQGGGKVLENFRNANQFLKIKKLSVQDLFDNFQRPHTVFLHSKKLTHPIVQAKRCASQDEFHNFLVKKYSSKQKV